MPAADQQAARRAARRDRLLFWLAPLVSVRPVVVCFLPIPFSPLLTAA